MSDIRYEGYGGQACVDDSWCRTALGGVPWVLAVTGGKGGVGKTLTTANLGLCLSRLGMRTLLIDGDFGLANLDVVLNLRAPFTLDDVLAGERYLHDIIIDGPEGLRVVPAGSGLLKVSELSRAHKILLMDQLESLDEEFDIVIIDTPAGISQNVQYWTASAVEVVVVVTPEPASMADAYATMKVLSQTTHQSRFRMIANMVRSDAEGLMVYEKMATIAEEHLRIGVDFLGSIPFDETVRTAVRERVPFVQRYPFSAAARGMRAVSAQLVAERNRAPKPKGTVQLFWRRLITGNQSELFS